MHGISNPATLAAKFAADADELGALGRRVQRAGDSQPRIDTAGWNGPASWACQVSLALLSRQIDESVELLRSAANLAGAAAGEVRGA